MHQGRVQDGAREVRSETLVRRRQGVNVFFQGPFHAGESPQIFSRFLVPCCHLNALLSHQGQRRRDQSRVCEVRALADATHLRICGACSDLWPGVVWWGLRSRRVMSSCAVCLWSTHGAAVRTLEPLPPSPTFWPPTPAP